MIRFNEDGSPKLTRGQKELVDAGIAAGMIDLSFSSTGVFFKIAFRTAPSPGVAQVQVNAAWHPNGRFHSCWVEEGNGATKSQSLKPAIDALERIAAKVKRKR